MSRTYRTSRRTFQPVPDSQCPRSVGYRSYQGREEVRLDMPMERTARAKRDFSKARRRGVRRMVERELADNGLGVRGM